MANPSFAGFLTPKHFPSYEDTLTYLLDPSDDIMVRNILPMKIGKFEIRKIEWNDFIGEPSETSPWIAHCYWNIEYEYQRVDLSEVEEKGPAQKQGTPPLPQVKVRQQSPRLPPKSNGGMGQLPLPPTLPPTSLPKGPKIPPQRTSSVQRTNRHQQANVSPNQGNKMSPGLQQHKPARSNSSQSLRKGSPKRAGIKVTITTKFSERSWAKNTTDNDLLEHEAGHYLIGCLCSLEFKRQAEQLVLNTSENYPSQIKKLFQTTLRTFLKIERDYDDETKHYCDEEMQKKWNRKIKEQLLLYELYFS